MNNLKITPFQIAIVVILLVIVSSIVYMYIKQPHIAYVRSQDLIEKYQGTLEARAEFNKKKSSMVANVDSLKIDFERAKNQYIGNMNKLSVSQRMEQEKILTQRQGQVIQYSEAIDQKVQEEDAKMMQEVLNQVNSFVEEYALRENYNLILGTTMSGSLLYGDKSLDITDQMIVELNNYYKGK